MRHFYLLKIMLQLIDQSNCGIFILRSFHPIKIYLRIKNIPQRQTSKFWKFGVLPWLSFLSFSLLIFHFIAAWEKLRSLASDYWNYNKRFVQEEIWYEISKKSVWNINSENKELNRSIYLKSIFQPLRRNCIISYQMF